MAHRTRWPIWQKIKARAPLAEHLAQGYHLVTISVSILSRRAGRLQRTVLAMIDVRDNEKLQGFAKGEGMVRVICIVGDAASGKTSTARALERQLPGWRFVSTGSRFRAYCEAHDIAPAEIPALPDSQHLAADEAMKHALATERQIIAEGRLVAFLADGLPDVFRVFIEAPLDVRARRYAQRENVTEAEAQLFITRRDSADREKFQRLYHIDYHEARYYDLIIDNTDLGIEEVADKILERVSDG
jgi:CMP/dCMP kinase